MPLWSRVVWHFQKLWWYIVRSGITEQWGIPTSAACWEVPVAWWWWNFLYYGLPDKLKWEFWHTVQSVINKSKYLAKHIWWSIQLGILGKDLYWLSALHPRFQVMTLLYRIGASSRKSDLMMNSVINHGHISAGEGLNTRTTVLDNSTSSTLDS